MRCTLLREVRGERKARSALRGFSLIEMMVVLGVISTLLALIMPAMSGLRTASRKLRCQTNLRQMSFALTRYSALWDGYPPALRYDQVDGVAHRIAWDWITTFSGDVVGPGAIWTFTDTPGQVMQCPGYEGPSNFEGDPYTGYNYNTSYVGGEATYADFGWGVVRAGINPAHVHRPDRTAAFGCGGYSGGANKFMRAPDNPEGGSWWVTYAGGQAFHYGGSTTVGYLDGHVDAVQRAREGNHATPELLSTLGFPRNGFLSNDDSAYNPR
jgi:prepilin-type N-terminal cleavage/methylation domain-containing protein/prepilin-type processing-associated H-X9-DG protein